MNQELLSLLGGRRSAAMEAAKSIIRQRNVELATLTKIATNTRNELWARIAAIYVLGFIDDSRQETSALLDILRGRNEPALVREYAAEALGNLRERRAIPLVNEILDRDESPALKRWCQYALREIEGLSTF